MTCVASLEKEGIVQRKGTASTYILIGRPEEAPSERLINRGQDKYDPPSRPRTRLANPIFVLTPDDHGALEIRPKSSVEQYAGITGSRGQLTETPRNCQGVVLLSVSRDLVLQLPSFFGQVGGN